MQFCYQQIPHYFVPSTLAPKFPKSDKTALRDHHQCRSEDSEMALSYRVQLTTIHSFEVAQKVVEAVESNCQVSRR